MATGRQVYVVQHGAITGQDSEIVTAIEIRPAAQPTTSRGGRGEAQGAERQRPSGQSQELPAFNLHRDC